MPTPALIPATIVAILFLVLSASAERLELTVAAAEATIGQDGLPAVAIQLDEKGMREFAAFTAKRVGKPVAVYVDDELMISPIILSPIVTGQSLITNLSSVEAAGNLALLLRSGQARMAVADPE
ncbi:SecDF P1 head subdomain-containing protein (plasmid) [Aquamicrobium terrae]